MRNLARPLFLPKAILNNNHTHILFVNSYTHVRSETKNTLIRILSFPDLISKYSTVIATYNFLNHILCQVSSIKRFMAILYPDKILSIQNELAFQTDTRYVVTM